MAAILPGPGKDRWPGSPVVDPVDSGPVDSGQNAKIPSSVPAPVVQATRKASEAEIELARSLKRRQALRLRVLSAVQQAALQFEETEVRQLVERALKNVKVQNTDFI